MRGCTKGYVMRGSVMRRSARVYHSGGIGSRYLHVDGCAYDRCCSYVVSASLSRNRLVLESRRERVRG